MGVVGSYPQQSPVDDSDKVLIQDGVSDETKYAEVGDIAEQALNHLTITTDANGWTKYDYGTHQVYKKRVSVAASKVANEVFNLTSSNLPVGIATVGTNFVSAALNVINSDTTAGGLQVATSDTVLLVKLKNI